MTGDALDLTPDGNERMLRFSAAHFRSGCPGAEDRVHMLQASHLRRLREKGGQAACVQCGMVVRVPQKGRLDLALNLVDNARRWAGLPRLTELERHFLRTVLGARAPLIEAQEETGGIFVQAPPPEPLPSPEDVVKAHTADCVHCHPELADEGARECERRLPGGPEAVECDGDVGAR